ncbi:MAG: glycosyl hydrolase, partial [Gemmatimonadetes bacterium]|nr:glycosyl hydrolase [Gemmatimonadota bacterium]
ITTGITASEFTRVIREDPVRKGLLFAGTERGVWTSVDDGAHWQPLQRNLPPVPIHDLVVKDADVVVGTHGRGFWILDDISSLRQLTTEVMAKDVHLFQPLDAYRTHGSATIQYWLKRGGQKVTLEFVDARGQVVRRFSSDPDSTESEAARVERARLDSLAALGVMPASAQAGGEGAAGGRGGRRFSFGGASRANNRAGTNTFSWNMRYPEPVSFRGLIMWAAGIFGPQAPSGTYTVRLTVGDKTETRTFKLLIDPRSGATQADLDEQFNFLIQIRDKTSEANNAVRTIRNVKGQLAARLKEPAAGRSPALKRLADALTEPLSAVEAEIYQVKNRSGQDPLNFPIKLNNQIAALSGVVASAEAKPTAQSYEVYKILAAQLDAELAKMKGLLAAPLAAVNAELTRLGLQAVTPSTVELPGEDPTAN